MDFNNSQTKINLMKAFAGESQARNRYTFSASQAVKDGYRQISEIFIETAQNEKEHAEIFYKLLLTKSNSCSCPQILITAGFPAVLSVTLENLSAAAAAEHDEAYSIYPSFAQIATDEGYNDVAHIFEEIAEIEKAHEERYLKLANNIMQNKVFKKSNEVKWKCSNCGYLHTGCDAPAVCPACHHTIDYYELFVENY